MIDHKARAHELYTRIKRTNHYPSDPLDEHAADIELIIEYGRAVERETWEAAAQHLETYPNRVLYNGETIAVLDERAQWCRQQGA